MYNTNDVPNVPDISKYLAPDYISQRQLKQFVEDFCEVTNLNECQRYAVTCAISIVSKKLDESLEDLWLPKAEKRNSPVRITLPELLAHDYNDCDAEYIWKLARTLFFGYVGTDTDYSEFEVFLYLMHCIAEWLEEDYRKDVEACANA